MAEPWQLWELRNPDGGATGLEWARAKVGILDRVLLHAAPERIDVEIHDEHGGIVAQGHDLRAEGSTPISRLTLTDGRFERENIWPSDDDLGTVVILPGGEAGILTAWWHADDHRSWRWSIELSNSVD
jgi:hypothetical protein